MTEKVKGKKAMEKLKTKLKEKLKTKPKIKLTKKKSIILIAIIVLIITALTIGAFALKNKSEAGNLGEESKDLQLQVKQSKDWELILVNKDNLLAKDFKVTLQGVESEKVDTRIIENLQAMHLAASEQGISLILCSGYRSVPRQEELYQQEIYTNIAAGLGEEDSIETAGKYINPPGSSEHHTGLAIDYLTENHIQLTESFAQTSAYQWLSANASTYGFIERYPKGKEEITKVNWEPWHYRYVGIENATKIKETGLCLEEYLEK